MSRWFFHSEERQETLGKELGATLPPDPVNKLGDCPDYDPITCWNENIKQFMIWFPTYPQWWQQCIDKIQAR